MNLRPRKPLREIPLPTTSYPSPISIPLKRNAPGSGGQCKMRKCSFTDRQTGCETVKKTRVQTTRSLKTFYEKDDLGIGKSPSRRLFVDEDIGTRYGIVGAVSNPRSSPCLSSRSSPCPTTPITPIDDDGVGHGIPLPNVEGENGTNIHDPGFTIYNDTTKRYLPQSPISTRNNVPNYPLAIDAPSHIPSSPCSVSSYAEDEDQENIPPPPPQSTMDTPRKREWEKMEKSKLGLESWVDPPSDPSDPFDEGFELTPGKSTGRVDIRLARRALLREVDRL